MMNHKSRHVSQTTGEEIPDWLELNEDSVVEGVGDLIVREESDGTWSVVRQVDGAKPEVYPDHATQEIAMKLARNYNEGGRILIERRVSKEIVAAGIRKGMVAKYGGSSVVVIGVDGNNIQILSPDGADRLVDISELTEVREAQEPGSEPVPFFDGTLPAESPAGMMAGEAEEEEERLRRELGLIEEEVLEEVLEEVTEEELAESPAGMMAGEAEEEEERLRSELGLIEEEAPEEYEEEPEEELDGLMIGPPVYFVEIEPTPGLRQSPLGASKTAAVHISQEKGERPDLRIKPSEMLDLYASIGIPLVRNAHHVKIGEVFLVFDESAGAFRLEDEIVNGSITPMTAGMTELEAQEVLQNHTDLPAASVSSILTGAKENGSISLGDRLGYLVQADLFLEPVEGQEGLLVVTDDGVAVTEPMNELEAHTTLLNSTSLTEESILRAVDMALLGQRPKIANIKIAKEAPICKKCNQRHWPFQPCSGTKPEKEESHAKDEQKAEDKEAAVIAKEAPVCKKCNQRHWPFQPCSGGKSDKADEKKKDLEKSDEPATTAGRVHMNFDWDEFYGSVMPQLSNGKFQGALAEIANSPPETIAAQEEKDLYDEELLLFGREASRRKLPDVFKLRFAIGSIVALAAEPDTEGKVVEYKGTDEAVSYLLDMPTGHQIWFKDAELKPTSNPDTTSVPWTERTKRIVDPENKRQDSDFKQDLNRKVGRTAAEDIDLTPDSYLYTDVDLEDAASAAVDETIPKEQVASAAENVETDRDPFDIAYELVQEYKEALLASGRRLLPDMAEESPDEEAFMHYARNVVTWDLPKPSDAHYAEAMRIGSGAKLKADYETEDEELLQIRDMGIVGRIVELNEKEAAVAFGKNVLLIGQNGLDVVAHFFRECTIRKCQPDDKDPKRPADEQVWCLYAKSSGNVLGRHPNRDEAREQERAIKAQGGLVTAEADICQDFVEKSLKDEQEGAKEYHDMANEMPPGSPKQKALDDMAKDEESHVTTLEKWKTGTKASVTREAPGPFGGEPGTTAEPAPKGAPISAPPGAPSRGRERTPSSVEVCICPISGKEVPKRAGMSCSSMESPGHPGVKLVAKPQGPPPSPDRKPAAASIETEAHFTTGQFISEYANCVVKRVQSGVITPADALKEINATAKEWSWSAKEKKYVKQRLEGKKPTLPETWALAAARPFNSGRTPAQDSISGGGVKALDVRKAQSDIATLLKDLPRGEAQAIIRSLDNTAEVSAALDGLGWGTDTDENRQWLIDAPGMTEDILRTYAGDPEPTNRLVALRAMSERFPQADVSAWLEDDFPFIAEKAQELISGIPTEEALPPPIPAQVPQIPQIPQIPESVSQVGSAKKSVAGPPGSSPPLFPENLESPTDEKEEKPVGSLKPRLKGSADTHVQLMLTHDTPNDQYVLYNMDFGLVSPSGADEKQIKGQLKSYDLDDDRISEALKEAKNNIVHIVASKREAQQDVTQFIYDAVLGAIQELSPEAPRANITMSAMDKFAELTANLDLDPAQYHNALKSSIDAELANYPRPEIPGSKQEFTQIAETKTGRTYEGPEKKKHIDDLAKHGIPLKETFEKEPPVDIPPDRRLSTGESRNGFTVGDNVRDFAVPELTGLVIDFGTGDTIRVAMDVSIYCPEGGVGLYLPDGLQNLGPSGYAKE